MVTSCTGLWRKMRKPNLTDSNTFKPVPTEATGTHGAASLIPVYKRLWVDPRYFRWITTVVWALGVGVTFGTIGDFSMLNVYLEREFNSTVTQLSWLGALPWCICCCFSPLANVITKRIGYRYTLAGSCLISALGLFGTSFVPSLWPAYLTYSLMVGGATVVLYTAGCVYITGYFDEKHCTGPISSNGVAFEIAVLIFSPVIQVSAEGWGWRWSLRLLSGLTLATSMLLLLCVRTPPLNPLDGEADGHDDAEKKPCHQSQNDHRRTVESAELGAKREHDDEPMTSESSRGVTQGELNLSSIHRYMRLFRMPSFWLFQMGIIISFTALSFNHINFGSYLSSVGVSDKKNAMFHSFLAGGALIGRVSVLFVHLLPFSILLTYPAICVLSSCLPILVLLVSQSWVLYVYAIAIGLLRGLYFSLTTGIALAVCGRENAAEAYASAFFAWGVGSILAAVVPGVTYDLTGSYTLTMIVCAVFWGVSAILFSIMYCLSRRSRASRPFQPQSKPRGAQKSLEWNGVTSVKQYTLVNTPASPSDILLIVEKLTTV